jgi:hypothetical protein
LASLLACFSARFASPTCWLCARACSNQLLGGNVWLTSDIKRVYVFLKKASAAPAWWAVKENIEVCKTQAIKKQ